MVEIRTKYKIGTRRFGSINWIGAWTLYKKEVLRFLVVWIQTIFSPLVSSLLFLLVLSLAIGTDRGEVLGVPCYFFSSRSYINANYTTIIFTFILLFMIGKIQGNIVDILMLHYLLRSYSGYNPSVGYKKRNDCCYINFTFKLLIDIEIINYFTLISFTLYPHLLWVQEV